MLLREAGKKKKSQLRVQPGRGGLEKREEFGDIRR